MVLFVLKNNGFPYIRFHDLRHTFTSLLIIGFYVHDFESSDKSSADMLQDLLVSDIKLV